MSIIFGVVTFDKVRPDAVTASKMEMACKAWPHDRMDHVSVANGFLGCAAQFNTPQALLCRQPFLSEDERYSIVFDGRLDNRAELARNVDLRIDDQTADELLIARAFARFGSEIGQRLVGDFAIAIYDNQLDQFFLIRDHLGVRPLFIARYENKIAFCSVKGPLLELDWVDQSIDKFWVSDLLAQSKIDRDRTIYCGIKTLPAAHWLSVSGKGTQLQKYWELTLHAKPLAGTEEQHISEFKRLLEQAVDCRLRSFTRNASEMSGGLDSTTVTAIASRLLQSRDEQIQAFSHVMPKANIGNVFPFVDEAEQMKAVCEMNPNILHTSIRGEGRGIADTIQRNVSNHSSPSRSDLTLPGEELLKTLDERGLRTLLSGFGGDQLVTSHASGWQQELASQGQWRQIWQNLKPTSPNLLSRLAAILKIRFPSLNGLRKKNTFDDLALRRALAVISDQLAITTGQPARMKTHPTRRRIGSVSQQEHDVVHSAHLVFRLEDSAVGAAWYGVDYRYPLLDIRLLQFCLNLPTQRKIDQGIKRRMIRLATVGILPEAVRLRDDKSGSTIPTVHPKFFQDRKRLLADIRRFEANDTFRSLANADAAKKYLEELELGENPKKEMSTGSVLNILKLGYWLEWVNESSGFKGAVKGIAPD